MRIDLIIAKIAKRGIIQQHQCLRYQKCHANYALSRCYDSLIKVKTPQNPHLLTSQFLRRSSYSTSSANPKKNGGFVAWYLAMIESRPVLTKAVSSSLIYAAADVTSQMITMTSSGSFDLIRTIRIAGYGLIFLGPTQHVWFNFMGRLLPNRDILSTFKKIVMGQTILGPIVVSILFIYNAALQGESGHEIVARLRRDMLPTIVNGLLYWPACDFLTYKIIPVRLQPLINSVFAYLWSIYLTYMASLEKAVDD